MPECPWCGARFKPRQTGGRAQQFCSTRCRRQMDAGLRAWAQDQLAAGRVTNVDLQRARCLGPRTSVPPVGGHQAGVQDASLERARWLSMNGDGV